MTSDRTTPAAAATRFADRHIGTDPAEQAEMLASLGYDSLEALMDAALPGSVRTGAPTLPPAMTETGVLSALRALAEANPKGEPLVGLGYYSTITPAVIRRRMLESPAWYTAYTPYQPEISQGRLEALLVFQTMVADLTGLDLANASMLDEATAAAEAVTMMRRSTKGHADRVLLDAGLLPQTRAVIETRCAPLGIDVQVIDPTRPPNEVLADDAFGVVLAYPAADGAFHDHAALTAAAHERGQLVTATTDLLALTLLEAPGTWGADIAVGSSQRFGVPIGFGGPHAGFMAVHNGMTRMLPGRLVGVSIDSAGAQAYRLSLQTREQHIRREKATSNICTAQVLLAVMAAMYAVYHGSAGLIQIATEIASRATRLATALRQGGVTVVHEHFFDTLLIRVPGKAQQVVSSAEIDGVYLRLIDADHVGASIGEATTDQHLRIVLRAFGLRGSSLADPNDPPETSLPPELARTTSFLTHETFGAYRSETAMLRYLRSLSDADYALDRGMIPLGSCTMKLNATTEMEPISYPGFANVHPFGPHPRGYLALIDQLEGWLAEVTGYAKVSVQPNAGSQGELAGLLAIRGYHHSRGDTDRDVCLIPSSAHGTNAASAVMAGMRVVVVKVGPDGTVDLDDLKAKCARYAQQLAAIMVTYPSTHGVYEEGIADLCELVHEHGGQVYVDGANLNALLGYAQPGRFGGDVSHLNLHKTFCIPHGGGGPGVGPIGVAEHLVPFLPTHPLHPDPARRTGVGPVSAAPFGSAGILPITWAYVAMMGSQGLTEATGAAVLAANYLAQQLKEHYPILYTGPHGLVAHEAILDLREITKRTGVTVDDVAKRLIDYGFHAPTMSFPVPGTLMVEPTESEPLGELQRFVAAMTAIKREIDDIEAGTVAVEESALRNAPHTAQVLVGPWDRAYTREQAVFPAGIAPGKYWPPVGRIDQPYGDRNLFCSCPPIATHPIMTHTDDVPTRRSTAATGSR